MITCCWDCCSQPLQAKARPPPSSMTVQYGSFSQYYLNAKVLACKPATGQLLTYTADSRQGTLVAVLPRLTATFIFTAATITRMCTPSAQKDL
jgi:hypothetical protein